MDLKAQKKIEDLIAEEQCHLSCSILEEDNEQVIQNLVLQISTALEKLGYYKVPQGKPPLISRTRAEFAVGETDCSGRKYLPDEWEDLVRTIINGAEIQRDMDYYDYYKIGKV